MSRGSLAALCGASGCCALVYEVVWTRWLALSAGNFATAMTAVVAVFMGGLAAGNVLGGRHSARWSPATALRRYAWLEAGVAVLGVCSLVVWSPESVPMRWLAGLAGGPAWRGVVCALPLLVPTMLMGATLPAAVRALDGAVTARELGWLYGANTLGGAAGVVGAAFWLIPLAGLRGAVVSAAVVNGTVALLAFRGAVSKTDATRSAVPTEVPAHAALWMAATTGFLALGFELALTRQFILTVTGSSVYGFAVVLAAFLGGIALGAGLLRRWAPGSSTQAWRRCGWALALAWACAMTTPFWDRVPAAMLPLWLKPLSFGARWAVDGAVVAVLTTGLTTAFGYALPALAAASGAGVVTAVGPLFAANTLGAVAGAMATGFVLLPALGLGSTLHVLGTGTLGAAVAAWMAGQESGRRRRLLPLLGLALVPMVLPVPDPIIMNLGVWNRPVLFEGSARGSYAAMFDRSAPRGSIIFQRDGHTGRIAVWRLTRPGADPLLSFIVNGKPDGSNGPSDMFTQLGSVHLAALSHPHPRRALVIGLGTGISAGSLVLHPEIEAVDVVDNEPAQVDVARIFSADNGGVLDNPRVHVVLDDARRQLAGDGRPYDLIFSEPSNLFVSGMVSLYTVEFYRLARARLAGGGVFLQWLHYYQMRPEEVRMAMRTFRAVFPEGTFWINPFGDSFLLARIGGVVVDLEDWTRRLSRPALAADLLRLRMTRPVEMLGFFLWGPEDLERFAGPGPLCTDDRPALEYSAPRNRYARDSTPARVAMQQFGPVAPMPLARESAAVRRRLSRLFAARHSDARAAAELARAKGLAGG